MRILAVLLASTISACGGGGSDPATPCTVDVFGDSVNHAAAPHLMAVLERRLGSGAVVVVDRSVPGTTSQQLVDGSDGVNAPWPQSYKADVGIVNHGINDSYAPLRITLEQYRANITRLAVSGMVLQTPSPTTSDLYDTAPHAQIVREVAAATGAPLADVQAYVLGLPGWKDHLPDGIHPDAELHAMIARDVTGPAVVAACY